MLYDKLVMPEERVTDYRTAITSITEQDLAEGEGSSHTVRLTGDDGFHSCEPL